MARVNMAPVNALLDWVNNTELPTSDFPEWATRAISGGYIDDIVDVCEWVKSLETSKA
jgi:hypothetical protein